MSLGTNFELKQPKPQKERYHDLVTFIKRGYYKIPKFQRSFVWSIEDTAKLLDSIMKGYPIGTFILWKTRERLNAIKELGGVDLPAPPEGDAVTYVLDGQQRLASLFVVLEGLQIRKGTKVTDYRQVYVRLAEGLDDDDAIVTSEEPEGEWITLYDMLSNDLEYLFTNYREQVNKIQAFRDRFTTYDFSTIVLEEYPIDAAVEIFTRINTTGTELTLFEIMVAKTYDEERDFDLQEKWVSLRDELENIGYDTVPSSTVLQCLAMNLVQDCRRKTILKLDKDKFIDIWEDTVDSIREAVDYFRTFYRIPASRLLPYNALLVPFSHFFYRNEDKPDALQEQLLREYFWRASLSYRYSAAVETKLGQDAKRIDKILEGERQDFDFKVILDEEQLREWWFSTGDSYCKAVLCLLASFKPRSFRNDAEITLDNSWLKQSNSKNYHHFFPRAYLKRQKLGNRNCVANITLVDDYLNKRVIRASPPSIYMRKFQGENPRLEESMKTHLIDDLDQFGVWDDGYDRFVQRRSRRILEELEKRIQVP